MDIKGILKQLWTAKVEISLGKLLIVILLLTSVLFFPWHLLNKKEILHNGKNGLGVYDLIRGVKNELAKADSARVFNNEAPLFKLKDLEMEISFVVREQKTISGETKFELITVEATNESENLNTQKLKLHWDAIPEKVDTVYGHGDIIIQDTVIAK
jgi:hypothetical protein